MSKKLDNLDEIYANSIIMKNRKEVDEIGKEVVETYGKDKLKEIAKINFKNTERILELRII